MAYVIKAERAPGVEPRQFSSAGRSHYRVRIFLQGDAEASLDDVRSVTYELHPTFPQRFRESTSHWNSFEIQVWTWGYFLTRATVRLKDGSEVRVENMIEW